MRVIVDLSKIKRICRKRKSVCEGLVNCPYLDEYGDCIADELTQQPNEWDLNRFKRVKENEDDN